MPHYHFDLYDGDIFVDDEGLELRDMGAVQREAARALAGLAWDKAARLKGAQIHEMAIAVRDENGPVMEVEFAFKIIRKQ